MNYVVTIKNNKFTFENSGWNTEKNVERFNQRITINETCERS